MLQIGKHTGWISVDDNELPEYGVEYSEDEKTATCWIPSKVGKNFVICWKNDGCSFYTSTRIIIDGLKIHGICLSPMSKPHTIRQHGVRTSATTEQAFIFSKVELTDDDDFLTASPGLGEIRLNINKAIFLERSTSSLKPVALSHKVHERSKKGIVHGTSLGDEVKAKPLSQSRTRVIERLATFVFKYRPLDVLQADGIAPKDTPTAVRPEPPKVEDVAESSGSLAARKRVLMEELRQIEELESRKRKSDSAEGGRVKKERRELVQLGGIIDLT